MDERYQIDAYSQVAPQTSYLPLCSFEQEIPNPRTQLQQQGELSLQYMPVSPQILADQQRAAIDYQKKSALIRVQEEARIYAYQAKQKINEESKIRVEKAKADIRIQKDMLANIVRLAEDGCIISTQELLMARPIEYSLTNCRVNGHPTRYITKDDSSGVLCLQVILQSQEERVLYLDLEKDRAEYYRKKFRRVGIVIRQKRSDKKGMIFDIIQALEQVAETVTLPQNRGFYRVEAQSLHYAGRGDLLWNEVKEYAR